MTVSQEIKSSTGYSLAQLRRMNAAKKSWKKIEPLWTESVRKNSELGIFKRDAAFAFFLGGCSIELENQGAITRKRFLELLDSSTEFGGKTPL